MGEAVIVLLSIESESKFDSMHFAAMLQETIEISVW